MSWLKKLSNQTNQWTAFSQWNLKKPNQPKTVGPNNTIFKAICSMIPTTISMFRGIHSWVNDGLFGQTSRKLLLLSQGSSMACSIITLTTLAFERYFAVVFPMWNAVIATKTRWTVALVWIASFAYTSPIIYAGKVRLYEGVPFCIEEWAPAFDPKRASAIYTIVSFVLLYALSLLVISILYSIIIAKVWARHIPGDSFFIAKCDNYYKLRRYICIPLWIFAENVMIRHLQVINN